MSNSILDQFAHGFSPEALAQDKEETEKALAGKYITKLPVGKSVFRFLPQPEGRTPWVAVHEHFVSIPGAQGVRVIVCPRMHGNPKRPCRVCTQAAKMEASKNMIEVQAGQKMSAKRGLKAFVIDRNNEELGVRVLKFSKTIHEALSSFRDQAVGLGSNFVHPLHGTDVIILRSGTGQNDTEYKVHLDPNGQRPIHSDAALMNEWLATITDIRDMAIAPSEEEISAILSGAKPHEVSGRPSFGGAQTGRLPAGQPNRAATPTAASRVHTGAIVDPDDE